MTSNSTTHPSDWRGRRLPGFQARDRMGRIFDTARDIISGPSVFLAGLRPTLIGTVARVADADTNILVLVDPGTAVDGPEFDDRRVIPLADPDGLIRTKLFGDPEFKNVLVADRTLRGLGFVQAGDGLSTGLGAHLDECRRDAAAAEHRSVTPVHIVERLFDDDLCRRMIDAFELDHSEGPVAVGVDGQTERQVRHDMKKRLDRQLDYSDTLYVEAARMMSERLIPELHKVWWIERLKTEAFYVARYDAGRQDFFKPHRDNTLPGTAKRRLAVSVELNDDYEGGGLMFPEYSNDRFRAPAGGALVFSCSLMHEALPVAEGARNVFLGFLNAP